MQCHLQNMLGYPASQDFNYDELFPFFRHPINNIGDPFVEGTAKDNCHKLEREVLKFWAELLRAPKDKWWGYVTNGGTEGNLYGLWLARECCPKGIVYYSEDTHYSIDKNLHFLKMPQARIPSQKNGEIDYKKLQKILTKNRKKPAIIFANIGTTMTEAKDDIRKIQEILKDLKIKDYYIHSDAAMCGAISPFLKPKPNFDFADGADSIVISGHKFIGSPIPCGIALALKKHKNRIAESIPYIGTVDTTISGSRSGLTSLILWYAMKTQSKKRMAVRVQRSLDLAVYAKTKLVEIGVPAWRNENAITVVFPAAKKELKEKWQLATANKISHIIIMPHLTKKKIDEFISDFKKSMKFTPSKTAAGLKKV